MTVIEHCIEFWTSFVPDFAEQTRGAAPAQIAGLERRRNRPLNALYREFLERMGEDTGPLDLGFYSTSPHYVMEQRPRVESLPENTELLAVPTGDNEEDIFLLFGDGPEPVAVRHPDLAYSRERVLDPAKTEAVAGSLSELLCLPAVSRYLALPQPFQVTYADKELRAGTLDRCRRLAAFLGFEPYWFSSAQTLAARRGSGVIVAKQAPGFVFSIGIAGGDEFEFGVASRAFFRELDLEHYR